MSRNKWTPESRVLRAVQPDRGGPTFRSTLENVAENHGSENGKRCVQALIDIGKLWRYGERRGTRYGLPPQRPRRFGTRG